MGFEENKLGELFDATAEDNPLKVARINKQSYYYDFMSSIKKLKDKVNDKQLSSLLKDKLQLGKSQVNLTQYYQSATEVSVLLKFSDVPDSEFSYEKPVTNETKKNPECAIKIGNFTLNVEAKSPDLSVHKTYLSGSGEAGEGDKAVIIGTYGRMPYYKNYINTLGNRISENKKDLNIYEKKNKDNSLKDFLCSSHEKFADVKDENELNVLSVALGDIYNLSQWFGYLVGNEGLFTKTPFYSPEEYSRVDAIVFTNILYRHQNHTKILGSAWNFDDAFCIHSASPHRQAEKTDALIFLSSFLHSQTEPLLEYRLSAQYRNHIGELGNHSLDALLLPYYKLTLEKRGQYYWDKPEGID